jgi:hypothetical protein
MFLENMQEQHFEQRVLLLSKEAIKEFLFSPIHSILIFCIISLVSYVSLASLSKLDTLSSSVNHLQTSIQLLNASLTVMDERTHRTEESLIKLEKQQ